MAQEIKSSYHTRGEKVNGYIQHWYSGIKKGQGIPTEEEKLEHVTFLCGINGVYLGKFQGYGFAAEEKFYDAESFLIHSSIVTCKKLNEEPEERIAHVHTRAENPRMRINIIAESNEQLMNSAKKLGLPLEKTLEERVHASVR